MTEDNKAENIGTPVSPPLTEGYQAIQAGHLNKGYQPTTVSTPLVPPRGGSVIAQSTQTTGMPPQGPNAPSTPPQGGSVIASSAIPEQK